MPLVKLTLQGLIIISQIHLLLLLLVLLLLLLLLIYLCLCAQYVNTVFFFFFFFGESLPTSLCTVISVFSCPLLLTCTVLIM